MVTILYSTGGRSVFGTTGMDYIAQDPSEVSQRISNNKSLIGRAGNDTIEAGFGNDKVYGSSGMDVLRGGPGNDRVEGGTGVDTAQYVYALSQYTIQKVQGGLVVWHTGAKPEGWPSGLPFLRDGKDTLFSVEYYTFNSFYGSQTSITYSLQAMSRLASRTSTLSLDQLLIDNEGYTVRKGTARSETLVGTDGKDHLQGGNGSDRLLGGKGSDLLQGGAGRDTFVFRLATESNAESEQDYILDFSFKEKDIFDLSRIDAKSSTTEDDAFVFIGKAKFSKSEGELRYSLKDGGLIVMADIDGDGRADLRFFVHDQSWMSSESFIL